MANSTITVNIRTIQNEVFPIQTNPCETVKNLKVQIYRARHPNFPAEETKLIYLGKYLVDDQRLCDYSVQDRSYILVVLKGEIKSESEDEEEEIPNAPDSPPPLVDDHDNTAALNHAEMLRYVQYQSLVIRICELGFTREQAVSALSVGGNNPDRAVAYLVNECLPNVPGNFPAMGIDAYAPRYLWNSPPASRRLSNPLISQVRINDIFAQAIADCQARTRLQDYAVEQEAALIYRTYENIEAAQRQAMGLNPQARLPGYALNSGLFMSSPADAWSNRWGFQVLRDCDHEAIERLKRIGGFSTRTVVEAYFICQRNEKAAAQYLITTHFRY